MAPFSTLHKVFYIIVGAGFSFNTMILPDLSATNVQKTKKQRADNVVSLDLRLFTSAMLGWELRRATLSAKRNRFPHGVLLGKWWYPWDGTFNNQPQFPYDVLEFRRISFIHYLDTTTQYEASKTYWNTTSFWKAQRQPFSSEKICKRKPHCGFRVSLFHISQN